MPFNKLKFNNLLLSHKKTVEKGRIQVIGKLVHKIRKLRPIIDKQNSVENNKLSTKLRKSIISLEYLKKCRVLQLMTKVLLLETPFSVLTNGTSTPDDIAIALMCTNKVILGLIQIFHQELELASPESVGWREELQRFCDTKMRAYKRKRVRLEKLARSGGDIKLGKSKEKKKKRTKPNAAKIKGVETSSNAKTLREPVDLKPANKSVSDKSGIWIEEPVEPGDVNVSLQPKKVQHKERKLQKDLEPKKTGAPSDVNVDDRIEPLLKFDTQKQLKPAKLKEESHVVDSFFITSSGDNYLSTAVPLIEKDVSKPKDKLEPTALSKNKNPLPSTEKRRFAEQNNSNGSWEAKRQKKEKNYSAVLCEQGKNKNSSMVKSTTTEVSNNKDSLHPSWLAKQKLKPTITAFQGKKIVFDNDE